MLKDELLRIIDEAGSKKKAAEILNITLYQLGKLCNRYNLVGTHKDKGRVSKFTREFNKLPDSIILNLASKLNYGQIARHYNVSPGFVRYKVLRIKEKLSV